LSAAEKNLLFHKLASPFRKDFDLARFIEQWQGWLPCGIVARSGLEDHYCLFGAFRQTYGWEDGWGGADLTGIRKIL